MEHSIDPLLNSVEDPIHYFMVFAIRYHDSRLAKDGEPIRSQRVEEALHSISQMMASLGSKDHHLIAHNKLEYRLSQQLSAWKHAALAPIRVKPVPYSLVQCCALEALSHNTPFKHAVANMATIGFFYLCCPSEHTLCSAESRSVPFCLCDIAFYHGSCWLLPTADYALLHLQLLLFLHIPIKRILCMARQLDMVTPMSLMLVL